VNCGLDPKLTFVKPESMPEININQGDSTILDGEAGDGTGTEKQYDVPKNITIEDIGHESEDPEGQKPPPAKIPDSRKPADKTQTPPATLPTDKKPKTLMPPPVKKPGGQR